MATLAQARSLRQRARHALRAGNYQHAAALAQAAHDTSGTATSKDLPHLAQLLHRATSRGDQHRP